MGFRCATKVPPALGLSTRLPCSHKPPTLNKEGEAKLGVQLRGRQAAHPTPAPGSRAPPRPLLPPPRPPAPRLRPHRVPSPPSTGPQQARCLYTASVHRSRSAWWPPLLPLGAVGEGQDGGRKGAQRPGPHGAAAQGADRQPCSPGSAAGASEQAPPLGAPKGG